MACPAPIIDTKRRGDFANHAQYPEPRARLPVHVYFQLLNRNPAPRSWLHFRQLEAHQVFACGKLCRERLEHQPPIVNRRDLKEGVVQAQFHVPLDTDGRRHVFQPTVRVSDGCHEDALQAFVIRQVGGGIVREQQPDRDLRIGWYACSPT